MVLPWRLELDARRAVVAVAALGGPDVTCTLHPHSSPSTAAACAQKRADKHIARELERRRFIRYEQVAHRPPVVTWPVFTARGVMPVPVLVFYSAREVAPARPVPR